MKDRAEMKAYVSLVENSLLPAEVIDFEFLHSLIIMHVRSLYLSIVRSGYLTLV